MEWTEGEDRFLKQEYKNMTKKEIGQILGRSEGSISQRAKKLNLKKRPKFPGDSDTHKTCRECLRVLPRNTDFFSKASRWNGLNSLHPYCKQCDSMKRKQNNILKKIREEAQAKEDWKESIANNKYICNKCGQEKLGKEMKISLVEKRVFKTCKKCDAKNNKEAKLKEIEKMDFSLK